MNEQTEAMAQPPTEPRRDELNLSIKDSNGREYGIFSTILDGNAELITLTDEEGDQTTFPAAVIRQLLAGVQMQENLIRETIMQAQYQDSQLAGLQQFPVRRQLGQY